VAIKSITSSFSNVLHLHNHWSCFRFHCTPVWATTLCTQKAWELKKKNKKKELFCRICLANPFPRTRTPYNVIVHIIIFLCWPHWVYLGHGFICHGLAVKSLCCKCWRFFFFCREVGHSRRAPTLVWLQVAFKNESIIKLGSSFPLYKTSMKLFFFLVYQEAEMSHS
jgi:hypothetical protein